MAPGILHARPYQAPLARRQRQHQPYVPRRSEPPAATSFLLVRHATHDLQDRILVGRMPGVGLSAEGVEEAHFLANRLKRQTIARVHTSPRQRAIETARIIAGSARVPLEVSFALDEIDVGAWTGLGFDDLACDGSWNLWNMMRGIARPPEGESMREVQERVMRYLARLHAGYPGDRIVLVSHAEVIRTAIMFCQGLPFDAYAEVEIAPADFVELTIDDDGARMIEQGEAA